MVISRNTVLLRVEWLSVTWDQSTGLPLSPLIPVLFLASVVTWNLVWQLRLLYPRGRMWCDRFSPFVTSSRRVPDYFGDEDRVSWPNQSTKNPIFALKILEPDMDQVVSTSISFSLGPLLSFLPLLALSQTSMAGPSYVATVARALLTFLFHAPVPTRVASSFSAAVPLCAVVLVSVDLDAVLSSSAGPALAGRSSTLLGFASSALSRLRAVVILAGLLPGGTSDASASDTATLSRQLALARCQRDAACQKLASVWSELCRVRAENDELCLTLALSMVPFMSHVRLSLRLYLDLTL